MVFSPFTIGRAQVCNSHTNIFWRALAFCEVCREQTSCVCLLALHVARRALRASLLAVASNTRRSLTLLLSSAPVVMFSYSFLRTRPRRTCSSGTSRTDKFADASLCTQRICLCWTIWRSLALSLSPRHVWKHSQYCRQRSFDALFRVVFVQYPSISRFLFLNAFLNIR